MQDRYRIGQAYGGTRHLAGHGTRESEWVHTGREFARSHPLGRFGGGVWFVWGFAALHMVLVLWELWALLAQGHPVQALPFCFLLLLDLAVLTLLPLRAPIASSMVWVVLVLSFPFSLPLLFYWADGQRPNLIYRHRFARPVPEKAA